MSKPTRHIPKTKAHNIRFDWERLFELMEVAGGVSAVCRAAHISRPSLYNISKTNDFPLTPSLKKIFAALGMNALSVRELIIEK